MSDYHARIMNIPAYGDAPFEYKEGHRDARHAAAEIALEAEAEVERLQARERELEASVPTVSDIHTAVTAARCWAKHHDAPDGRIEAACGRLIETLRPRLAALAAVSAETEDDDE